MLVCFFPAGVKFRVLEQEAGKPLRLLMQVHLRVAQGHLLVVRVFGKALSVHPHPSRLLGQDPSKPPVE